MKILVISPYPTKKNPISGIFVYRLVQEFVKLGNEVTVISPVNYNVFNVKSNEGLADLATVIRPSVLSFSNKKIGFFDTYSLTRFFRARKIQKTLNKISVKPNVIYCHFLVSALSYLEGNANPNKSLYLAVGENKWIDILTNHYGRDYLVQSLEKINGFIAVSEKVKEKLLTLKVSENKISVEPNSTDLSIFKPGNKHELRIKHNFPTEKKIIIFVGSFIHSKGTLRVQEALDSLGEDVVAIFIGKGSDVVEHVKIIFSGSVEHATVAEYLALSDVFVLPTLHEGSSNAIIEAMACGLPIVSSDIQDVRVQCKPTFSILVDPMSVDMIAKALNKLLTDDALRMEMSSCAQTEAQNYNLTNRAQRILNFINSREKSIN